MEPLAQVEYDSLILVIILLCKYTLNRNFYDREVE